MKMKRTFKKIMKKYMFEEREGYFSRIEEEHSYEVIRVGNRYVVRVENSCRANVDVCSNLEELESLLRDVLDYYDGYSQY